MLNPYEIATFALYLLAVTAVGLHFYFRRLNMDEYVLGGKRLGIWITAISAQTSDMSGWLLLALPGAVYLHGLGVAWIAVGLAAGTVLNWVFVAPRLRAFTGRTDSLTLPHFFEKRFGDPTGLLRILSAVVILYFFTIYAASGLNALAKLFEALLGIPFSVALFAGGVFVVGYTFLGGYLAVCWTDVLQGALMLFAVVAVPLLTWAKAGGPAGIAGAAEAAGVSLDILPKGEGVLLAAVSAAAWGLGYFGMPHILARFMSVARVRDLAPAAWIAACWTALCLFFSCAIGLVGLSLVPGLAPPDNESLFLLLSRRMFHPMMSGVLLAAVLAAIMSTIDSQLLASASVLTEDLNRKLGLRDLTEKQRLVIGRIGVATISVIAVIAAADRDYSIHKMVEYAWGGLGASFGPVVLMALYSRRANWQSALLGMWMGTVSLLAWRHLGMNEHMYEIVPGFFINLLAIIAGNRIWPDTEPEIVRQFDDHIDACE